MTRLVTDIIFKFVNTPKLTCNTPYIKKTFIN